MKKLFVIGIILLLVLVSVGCDEDTDVTSPSRAFLGGEAGLKAEFINGMPPDEILDKESQTFGIGLELENMGEVSVLEGEGYVEIVGINGPDFGVDQDTLKKDIDDGISGVKKNINGERIAGGFGLVEFTDLKYLQDIPGEVTLPMTADICYNYKTRAATKICVKKDLLEGIGEDKICEVSGEKDIQNSGAPIHITGLTQNPIGKNKIQLLFKIGHVGDPEDSFFEKDKDCRDVEGNVERYKVFLDVLTKVNGKSVECNGLEGGDEKSNGFITLYDKGERQISCTLDVSNAETIFEKVLDVELEYRYMQSLKKEILIKDVS